jgi:dTDP-4-amino-4,6-dideoxygalactose transaminase
MGEMLDGKALGTLGDVGFFSLGRGKAISTVEGGIILTNRDDIAEVLSRRVSALPGYGFTQTLLLFFKAKALMVFTHPLLFWIPRSLPFLGLGKTFIELHFPIRRMSPFQAGLAANWQSRLQKLHDIRKANATRWASRLESSGNRGSGFQYSITWGPLRYPVRIRDAKKRASLLQESENAGAGIAPVYPESINRVAALKAEASAGTFPVAESYAAELVTLPTHGHLRQKDVTLIESLVGRALS